MPHDPNANDEPAPGIRTAQVVLPCGELQPTLDFFVDTLGFRLLTIAPADDPRRAILSGHGLRVELRRGSNEPPGTVRLLVDDPDALGDGARELLAPNGTRIEVADADPPLHVPAGRQELVVARAGDDAAWVTGRAGMRYRDLVPGRLGGRFIASHIAIPDGGPVPDAVHFHAIRFQMIACVRGWVRVVYEDQGPPIVMRAGDCVLQPPRIRHRVLESSPGLEVIEIACPAEHETHLDHDLTLPTATRQPQRDFGGQRFVFHQACGASWQAWRVAGYESRDAGIAAATDGLACVRFVRPASAEPPRRWRHDGELLLLAVLTGRVVLQGARPGPLQLGPGDSVVVPAGNECALAEATSDLELLEVALPEPRALDA